MDPGLAVARSWRALEPGRSLLDAAGVDAVRLRRRPMARPAVTAAQIREVTERIIAAGHWRDGDPDIGWPVFDAGV